MSGGGGNRMSVGAGYQMNNNTTGMNQLNGFQMGLMNQNQGVGDGGMGDGGMGGMSSFNDMAAPQANNNKVPLDERKDSSVSSAAGQGNDSGLDSASVTSASLGNATTSGQAAQTPGERLALLQKLKEDIAKRERDMAALEASLVGNKDNDDEGDSSRNKRVKTEKDVQSTAV